VLKTLSLRCGLLALISFGLIAAEGGTVAVQLSGSLPLRSAPSLFGPADLSLYEATALIRQALAAPEPEVFLDLSSGFSPSLAAAEELVEIIRAERGAPGAKKITALIDMLDDRGLIVAAACDEVIVSEAGMVAAMGLSLGTVYMKEALAKVGITVHAVASGEHKTAHETFTANGPSPAAAADLKRLLNGLDATCVALMARPGLDVAAARARAPQPGALAVELKLADRTAEIGDVLAALPENTRWLEHGHRAPDLSSLPGMLAFWRQLMEGNDEPRRPKVVAVVELEGEIVDGSDSRPGEVIAGDDTAEMFDDLAKDERVVALVVRINSPGGSATASDRIHHALRRCAKVKPVVALFDSVCASGGYYIGCAAHEIQVHRSTITGSIGVFAIVPDVTGTLDWLGVRRFSVTTGPRADLEDLTAPFTAERQHALEQAIHAIDVRFQELVATTRNLPIESMPGLAGGRVYTGEEAVGNKLADGFGTLLTAVKAARARAGIEQPLPIERHPKDKGLLEQLGLGKAQTLALPGSVRVTRWLAALHRPTPTVLAWCNIAP